MSALTVTLSLPAWIEWGITSGAYERVGGVIRNKQTKRIVAWLRETGRASDVAPQIFSLLPNIGAAASLLNLGFSAMGFAVVLHRLHKLEERTRAMQAVLQQIDQKIDIGFYGNVRAALDLASNAFTMTSAENCKASAMLAITRFAEARHHYTALVDMELDKRSQVVDEYLSTLALAYVSEARCLLELEESDTAVRLLEQGVTVLRTRAARYVTMLLTSNPAIYLHPTLKGQVDLRRVTQPFQWLNPELDEVAVFERLRQDLFDLAHQSRKWIDALPPAIWDSRVDLQDRGVNLPVFKRTWNPKADLLKHGISLPTSKRDVEAQVYERLPIAMEAMEATIEDAHRFEGYLLEVQSIQQLGLSFREWQHLMPASDMHSDGSEELMYIVLPEPINMAKEDG